MSFNGMKAEELITLRNEWLPRLEIFETIIKAGFFNKNSNKKIIYAIARYWLIEQDEELECPGCNEPLCGLSCEKGMDLVDLLGGIEKIQLKGGEKWKKKK